MPPCGRAHLSCIAKKSISQISNAPVLYPTMHYLVIEMCAHLCYETVHCGMFLMHCGIYEMDLSHDCEQVGDARTLSISSYENGLVLVEYSDCSTRKVYLDTAKLKYLICDMCCDGKMNLKWNMIGYDVYHIHFTAYHKIYPYVSALSKYYNPSKKTM